MKLPMIITNFKATQTSVGKNAVSIAKIHEKVANDTGANIIVAVQSTDIVQVANSVNIPVFAQHIDGVSYGSHTGKIPPELVKEAGAVGTILNHSENRFKSHEELGKAITRAKEAGLFVVCCAETADEGAKIMQEFAPDLIAVEPPELIGGDISVSTAQPELIKESVDKIGAGKVLVGAGVKNAEDVKIASKLGAVGILVASGVTKSSDPEAALLDLASGL